METIDDQKQFFGKQVNNCSSQLYKAALSLTKNTSDAEDLVAEAVMKGWKAFDSLEDRNRFTPWLFRIMHHCFVSQYRKKSVRPRETCYDELSTSEGSHDELVDLLLEQPDNFQLWWANPERDFANKILGKHITEAIETLPDAFRSAIVLVNVAGMSYDDAAEVLQVPPGTVRSRMKRGRLLLQKQLWQYGLDAGLVKEIKHKESQHD